MAPSRKAPLGVAPGEEALIAVLLADSFNQRFRPITLERPKVLLPLVGVPLLDYTLEWLASNNVAEVHVICCAHAEQVKQHLEAAGWLQERASLSVKVIVSTTCKSAGEALREIDVKDMIKSDFVLVSGDVVSNMDLGSAVHAHRARREKNKNALMTMVMKAGTTPAQRRRLGDHSLLVAMDPQTKRLLRYEEVEAGKPLPKQATIDAHFWGEADAVEVRTDLADTYIYICAPEVLMLFSDNFDFQNVRKDFVTGVLSEEELGQQLHVHELHRDYAACVLNARSYDAISRDVLQRWTFPFVPDTNLLPIGGAWGSSTFRLGRQFKYKEHSVKLGREARIGHSTCIGAGTVIEDGAEVAQSVIGRNCHIGKDAVVVGSYLLEGVRIHNGAQVSHSLLCDGVVVKEDASVCPGSILSFKVVVGQGKVIKPLTSLSLCRQLQQSASLSDDELEYAMAGTASPPSEAAGGRSPEASGPGAEEDAAAALSDGGDGGGLYDVSVVGPDGAGHQWQPHDVDPYGLAAAAPRFSIAPPPPGPSPQPEDELSEEDELTAAAAEEAAQDAAAADPEASFKREVAETFLRCVHDGFDQDLAVIELNGLKIAEHRDFADCARYILTTMLTLCLPAPPRAKADYHSLFADTAPDTATPTGKTELLTRLQRLLKTWAPLLQKFLRSEDDQVDLLLTLEEFCGEEGVFEGTGEQGSLFSAVFAKVLQLLYDTDVIEEDAFFKWADEKANAEAEDRVFLAKAAEFIKWLREAEEEEESDDEDEDED
ncbi:Translation initiation factor eIF-2B subunit epsilon [Coccomyxa sp. Obi]|nr:Translation initiation factor eIF-2B subunit epsilon [Coccomyxa sp. Obi]